jgi:hypothetical protein
MKRLAIAATALLFGTSAYAMVPADKDPSIVTGASAVASAAEAAKLAAASTWEADAGVKADGDMDADMDADLDEAWAADAAAKAAADKANVDGDADVAADEAEATIEPAVEQLEPVAAETSAVEDEAAPVEDGVGGPYEAVAGASDLTPRPAAANYPACRPGPGDDRCIQLYEPGVRQQLAAWSQPTGGLAGSSDARVATADSTTETERLNQLALAESNRAVQMASAETAAADSQVAMGGPYEPVADDAAMSGDGSVDTAMGETAEDEEVA